MVIVAEKLYVPPRIWMVCPGCTRVMAEVSVVGALIVPGFESVPFGATKISPDDAACGVALAWFELPLSPAEFTAETTKKYVVPLVSPVLVKVVERTRGAPFVSGRSSVVPGCTWELVDLSEAVQLNEPCSLSEAAMRLIGSAGSATCGVALAWFELPLSPAEFTAETTKKYVVPLVRPVFVKLVEVTPAPIVL